MVCTDKRFGTIKFFEIFFCIFWILPSKNDLSWKKSFLDFANDPPFISNSGGKQKIFKRRFFKPVCNFGNQGLAFWNVYVTIRHRIFLSSDYVVELIFSSYKFGCLPSTFLLIQEINKVALLEGSNIIDLVNDNGYKKIFY